MNIELPVTVMGIFSKLFQRKPPDVPELLARRATEHLTDLLRHEDRSIRLQAVAALHQLKAASSVEPLRNLLVGTDSEIREAAAAVLIAIGPAAVAALAAIVSAKYGAYEPKVAAARALGQIGDPGAVAPLLVAMNDMTANVRSAAADALVQLGAPAVPGLLALLQDASNTKRDEVPAPLAKIGDPRAIEVLLRALMESPESEWRVRHAAIASLVAFPEVPNAPFFRLLLDPSHSIRNDAAQRLAQADPGWKSDPAMEGAVATALQLARDADKENRCIALELLGRLEHRQFAGVIVQALADPEVHVREQACVILGSWKEPGAIEPLLGRLMDDNGWVCQAAGKALAAIDPAWRTSDSGSRARDGLVRNLRDPDTKARVAALRGLAEFRDPTTVEAVAGRLTDADCYVRDQAVHTLKAIGGTNAVRHIIMALRDSDLLIRSTAARCLGELAVPEAVAPLQQALQAATSSLIAEKITEALAKLREAGFPTDAAATSETTFVPIRSEAGVTILKFPRGFEPQWERHWRLVAELKRSGLLPDLAAHRATPRNDLPALIILTGPPGAIGALGKVYFSKVAEEYVRRECGGDWQAINAASSLSNVTDPGTTADIQAVNEFIRKIGPDNYNVVALVDHPHPGERRPERQEYQPGIGPAAGAHAASVNPICPQCRTIYNRREVIRQLKQASPFLFDAAIWTTKFRCVKCAAVLIISGSAPE